MKHFSRIFLTFLIHLTCSHGFCQWNDSFSDGDLTNNPTWQGDVSSFSVVNDELTLNAPGPGTSNLFTGLSLSGDEVLEWKFRIALDFAPSGNNFARVFLWSEQAEFYTGENAATATAYYVQLGEGGSDDAIELFRIDAGSDSPVSICRGTEGNLAGAFSKKYRIVYSNGEWQLFSGEWEGSGYVLETTGSDIANLGSGYFSLWLKYTASHTQDFSFDDIETGIFVSDTFPPELIGGEALSENQLLLRFSEPLDTATLTPENYQLINIENNVFSIVFNDADNSEILIHWQSGFPPYQPLSLSIDSIADLSGNYNYSITFDFVWQPLYEAGPGDIRFNELFPDPTPQVSLPLAEFIELANISDSVINTGQLVFFNTSIAIPFPEFSFAPGTYLILCDEEDTILFQSYGQVIGLANWPALVNSGDSLTLVNSNTGQIIDILVYSSVWYQDDEKDEGGWSLELINPLWPCNPQQNWIASENSNGGTPGQINSVFDNTPDSLGPEISGFQVISDQLLQISLSEPPEEILTLEQIEIPGIEIQNLEFGENDFESILIWLSEPLEQGQDYEISLIQVHDCWGNFSQESHPFNAGYFALPGQVIINELMADPNPVQLLPDAEFIELMNVSEHAFTMLNWQLDNSGSRKEIPTKVIEAGGYLILCKSQDTALFAPFGNTIGLESWGSLANTRDSISLVNDKGQIISQVVYSKSWYRDSFKQEGGWSLERIDPQSNCQGKSNFSAAEINSGGTPGSSNSVFGLEVENEVIITQAYSPDSNQLILAFLGEPDTASLSDITLLSEPQLGLQFSEVLNAGNPLLVLLETSFSISSDTIYHLIISGLQTCNGISVLEQELDFGIPKPALKGDVVLNEILFNPFSGGEDFIEIINNSTHFIDLFNWRFSEFIEGEFKAENTLSKSHLMIAPNEILAFSPDPNTLLSFYFTISFNQIILNEGLPNFPDDEATVLLLNPNLKIIDSLTYSKNMHFSLLDDLNGVSLERINPTESTSNTNNWASAAENAGFATPGMPNSQLFVANREVGKVVLQPEMFTPDNDGQNDRLHIIYQLNEGGWMGNIRIYNDLGTEVRRLMNNDWLGSNGMKSWDGTLENGSKAPIGIYIVYFEVFNAQGQKQIFKQTCVLGARL